jgi:hypothetical protein
MPKRTPTTSVKAKKAAHVYPSMGVNGDVAATRDEYEAWLAKSKGARGKAKSGQAAATTTQFNLPAGKVKKTTAKRAQSPRGKKLTIAENVRMGEPPVTGNNIGAKIRFQRK